MVEVSSLVSELIRMPSLQAKQVLGTLLCLLFAVATDVNAQSAADNNPTRPITFLVGYGPGGPTDLVARIISQKMFADQGPRIIVENKPGAGGRVAAEIFAKQKPDGTHFMVAGNGTISIAKVIYPKLAFDPIKDFTPVTPIVNITNLTLVVPADHPAKTFNELVAWTKANPGKSNYPVAAPTMAIPAEQLKLKSGLQAQLVIYRSSAESIQSLLSGQTTFTLADSGLAAPLIEGGKLRALAVASETRLPGKLKDIPTLRELGHHVDVDMWVGLFAPAGTPEAIVEKFQKEVRRVVLLPDVATKLREMGYEPGGATSEEYRRRIAAEVVSAGNTVKAAGLKFAE